MKIIFGQQIKCGLYLEIKYGFYLWKTTLSHKKIFYIK